jgi:small subunit ribosomal protein S13
MARIFGVEVPSNKRGEVALTYIFGIGRSKAKAILETVGIDPNSKVKDWDDAQLKSVRTEISENHTVEGELKGQIQMDIKRLQDIGCYRGIRHRLNLPLRGQKTKNNARTKKGKKKTIANKKK